MKNEQNNTEDSNGIKETAAQKDAEKSFDSKIKTEKEKINSVSGWKKLINPKKWQWRKWPRKKVMVILAILIILLAGFWLIKKIYKPAPKFVYEILVMTRSQNNPNPSEDQKSSLKAGDVIVINKEGHNWSHTERISYLILKMRLTEKQAQKIISPDEKELKEKDLSQEERDRIQEEKKRAKKENRKYKPETRRETIRPRLYYVNLSKYFPDFKPNDTLNGQPYLDKIYDWSIVDKKKKI